MKTYLFSHFYHDSRPFVFKSSAIKVKYNVFAFCDRYGEQAGEITNEGLGAAGHAIGTAWAVFKLRKALNPKSAIKPTTLAKSAVKAAAADLKAKQSKK